MDAVGTAPLSYQWTRNGSDIGSNSPTFTTAATTMADNGAVFAVTVSNMAGSVSSMPATLAVTAAAAAPSITTQPASQTVTAGQAATFSVVASGTAPLSYQWKRNGSTISGATSSSFTTTATTTADSGSTYSVTVSNSAGSVTSASATLTVNTAPVAPGITTQPASVTVTAGQTATFSVAASGTAPLTYQWKKNGAAIGTNSPSFTTAATTTADSGSAFTVTVSNSAGSVTSASATLTVNAAAVAPSITTQPASVAVTAGQPATFSVVAGGTAPLTYQWKKNGAAIGTNSSSFTTAATTTADSGSAIIVTVSNSAGSITSATATLTVNAAPVAPSISTQPANKTVTAGQTATFSVAASGTAPLSYQWKKNGTAISGATSSSFTTAATTTADSGSAFTVTVSNSAGSVTSATATLTVNPAAVAPSITTQPVAISVTAGLPATFLVVATGTSPLNYQWSRNGTAISGATSSSFTIAITTTADNGASFTVAVSNSAGSVTSNAVVLTVGADTTPPSVSITSPASGATVSGTISVTANASDNVGVKNVQLQVDGSNSGTADTTSPYSFSLNTAALSNGSHSLTAVASDAAGNTTTSTAVNVTVSNQTGVTEPTFANNATACNVNDTPGSGATDSVFTYTCPLPNPTAAGNLLIVMLRWQNNSNPSVSFTDEVNNSYQKAISCTDSSNGTVTGLFYVQNTKPGARNIVANFSSFTGEVAMGEYEFYNIAQTAALDQAACNTGSSTTVTSGALPALGSSGDLVFHYGMVDHAAMISGCSQPGQANINWTWRTTMILDNEPQCAQYGVYNSTASFSPSFKTSGSVSYVSASAAFKADTAGTAPPSGIRVNYVQHDNSTVQNTTSALTQVPLSGNLAVVMYTGSLDFVTGITDGANTWTHVGPDHTCNPTSGPGQCSGIWYALIAAPGTYNLHFAKTAMSVVGFGDSFMVFDISGASTSPVDMGFGTSGLAATTGTQAQSGSGGPVVSITAAPTGTNELILTSMNAQFDTFTGLTSPPGASFLANHYTNETNSSHADLNGGWGLLYNDSSLAPETWTWTHDASQGPGVNTWTVLGAAFVPAK